MEKSEFIIITEKTLGDISTTIHKKGKEYSTGDVFSNFKNSSGGLSFHNKPEMVAWEFATKHFQSIKDIISGKVEYNKETIDEKFNDAIIYLLLMKGMMIEKEEAVEQVRLKYEVTR
jgi:hypothetical protein